MVKMRYLLRKPKEQKTKPIEPVKLCFDKKSKSEDTKPGLESIEELTHETSFEMNQQLNSKKSPRIDNCIITRSKLKQQQQQSSSSASTPIIKKLIENNLFKQATSTLRKQQFKQQLQQKQQPQKQEPKEDDSIKQNLFNKFIETESSDDDKNKKTTTTTPPSAKTLVCTSSSSDEKESDDDVNKTVKINRGPTPPHKRFRKLRLYDLPQTPKTLIKKSANIDVKKTPVTTRRSVSSKTGDSPRVIHIETPKCGNSEEDVSKVSLRMRLFDQNGEFNENGVVSSKPIHHHHHHQHSSLTVINSLIIESNSKIRSPLLSFQPQANINPFTPNQNYDNSSSSVSTSTTSNSSTSLLNNNFNSNSNSHDLVNENNFINNQLSESTINSFLKGQTTSVKRNRNDSRSTDELTDHYDEHCDDCDIPKNKRLALRQCLVSRYHEEFHEVCKLGSGEFGDVFKCINRLDGCTYAIKRSKRPIAGSALEISAWKEVCAHAVLVKHKYIVQYYSAWAEADRMLIQNEYCNGGSLAEHIEINKYNNKIMSETDLKVLLLHTVKGLGYMHSLNLVHLDIKPGNIFICRHIRMPQSSVMLNEESGIESEMENEDNMADLISYKIGDLGHVTSTLDARVEEGDCRYLPNEILQENYSYLPKADIFALALTVYVAGTNEELPKNGDEWHWIRQGNLKELPQCSEKFNKLLVQMVSDIPTLRPSASNLIRHPCISPSSSKNKGQLLKELNQEKFKNEVLTRKVQQYEKQIKVVPPKNPCKFTRSSSCNLIS